MLPAGFTSRPPTIDDVEAVVHVENSRALHDIGAADTTVARLRMFWEGPEFDLAGDAVVVLNPDGQVIAYADFGEYEPYVVHEVEITIMPGYEGCGIEEFLFDWVSARAQRVVFKAPAGERVAVQVNVWSTNIALQQRYLASGFQQVRVWHRMQIDMDVPPPAPVWPAEISVRTFDPGEVDAVHAAWEDAQADEWGHGSLTDEEFRFYFVEREEGFDPTLWFLAIDDTTDDIIGYTICRWERPGEPEAGQVRYVAVRRPFRRRGIARALLLHTFREFFQRGKPRVSLTVDSTSLTGADRLYTNAGMRPVQSSLVFEREIRAAR